MALEGKIPGLTVNLGYNHPVVAKMRLAEQLTAAKKQLENASADEAKAKQRLERAQKEIEMLHARVAEIEKQLQALDGTADGS
jgi:predicted  nucleic acid-binding Zn-ribbon protein